MKNKDNLTKLIYELMFNQFKINDPSILNNYCRLLSELLYPEDLEIVLLKLGKKYALNADPYKKIPTVEHIRLAYFEYGERYRNQEKKNKIKCLDCGDTGLFMGIYDLTKHHFIKKHFAIASNRLYINDLYCHCEAGSRIGYCDANPIKGFKGISPATRREFIDLYSWGLRGNYEAEKAMDEHIDKCRKLKEKQDAHVLTDEYIATVVKPPKEC